MYPPPKIPAIAIRSRMRRKVLLPNDCDGGCGWLPGLPVAVKIFDGGVDDELFVSIQNSLCRYEGPIDLHTKEMTKNPNGEPTKTHQRQQEREH